MLEYWAERTLDRPDIPDVFENELEVERVRMRLWNRIKESSALPSARMVRISPWVWLSAACIALLITGAYLFVPPISGTTLGSSAKQGVETRNNSGTSQKMILADGSSVLLERNARLIADENFGKDNRRVYLTGEAFFDIKRNEKVPFQVYSGDLVTEVLGTSFRIKPQPQETKIEVSVKSGKVSVYASKPEKNGKFEGVIITQNQKVLFDTEKKTIRLGIIDSPEIINNQISKPTFLFTENTVEEVLNCIRTSYGVEIMVADTSLNNCRFSGNLEGLDMYEQLHLLSESINATYEIRGVTVFISGSGCH
ncbi:FecR family protein [Telluribacter sp.]|uniref:FecR family protein n=1 Tax=Telluribacter sp. TaxID=1978767 RepID=UPI002E12CD1B|nr:FecR family protein [Telluribacter sp.]